MYSKNIVNFQESTTILNACKKSLETYWRHIIYSDWYSLLDKAISLIYQYTWERL